MSGQSARLRTRSVAEQRLGAPRRRRGPTGRPRPRAGTRSALGWVARFAASRAADGTSISCLPRSARSSAERVEDPVGVALDEDEAAERRVADPIAASTSARFVALRGDRNGTHGRERDARLRRGGRAATTATATRPGPGDAGTSGSRAGADGATLTAGEGDPRPATPPDWRRTRAESTPPPSATATASTARTAAATIAGPSQRRGPGPGGGAAGGPCCGTRGAAGRSPGRGRSRARAYRHAPSPAIARPGGQKNAPSGRADGA